MLKGGLYLHKTGGADVEHGTWDPRRCDMARKAMWQCHANPGAKVVRTRGKATRVHADARVVPRGRD